MKRFFIRNQNRKWFLIFVIASILDISIFYGQPNYHFNLGAGGGLSYGGFGARLTYLPIKSVGIFGCLGYNLDALGYNIGLQLHIPSEKKLGFYMTGMYGYNSVLIVEAILAKSKNTFYGFSAGPGIQFGLTERSFLSAEVLVPFRPDVYRNAIDDFERMGFDLRKPLPVLFCIGYHFHF